MIDYANPPWMAQPGWLEKHATHVVMYAIAATVIGTATALATTALVGAIIAAAITATKLFKI